MKQQTLLSRLLLPVLVVLILLPPLSCLIFQMCIRDSCLCVEKQRQVVVAFVTGFLHGIFTSYYFSRGHFLCDIELTQMYLFCPLTMYWGNNILLTYF